MEVGTESSRAVVGMVKQSEVGVGELKQSEVGVEVTYYFGNGAGEIEQQGLWL